MPRFQLSSSYSSAPYYSSFPSDCSSMSISGIQGQLLEVTVIGCNKLRDTEWISRQDPYVCLEYANTKHRTRTCTDGGKHPTFQEKFVFPLVEGLREINVMVWNSNTVTSDDFIGGGKVQLQKVLTQGYDDSAWPLQTKHGRYAGEVRLIMHYSKTNVNCTLSQYNRNRHQAMLRLQHHMAHHMHHKLIYIQPPHLQVIMHHQRLDLTHQCQQATQLHLPILHTRLIQQGIHHLHMVPIHRRMALLHLPILPHHTHQLQHIPHPHNPHPILQILFLDFILHHRTKIELLHLYRKKSEISPRPQMKMRLIRCGGTNCV